jgi:hypothetical protein
MEPSSLFAIVLAKGSSPAGLASEAHGSLPRIATT